MNCPICGVGTAKKIKKEHQAKYNKQIVNVADAEMFRCNKCGETFFSPDQAKAFSLAVKNEIRKRLNLLPPDRILEIRTKLQLTQEDLEQLFGLGPKVVTRWETGRVVQSKTADLALRLFEHMPTLLIFARAVEEQRLRSRRHYA